MHAHRRPIVALLIAGLVALALTGCLPREKRTAAPREHASRVVPTVPAPDDPPATKPAPTPDRETPPAPRKPTATPDPKPAPKPDVKPRPAVPTLDTSRAGIVARFADESPTGWGMDLAGIRSHVSGTGKVIALTFDACGTTEAGKACDHDLIDFLRREKVPATLFWSGLWVDANPALAAELAKDPLFQIENHGLAHKPCAVNGRAAYGLPGTKDAGEVYDEVMGNADKLAALTGRRPRYFRSGTAHYDDVAVKIIRALGHEIAGFAVNGDAGATASAANVEKALLTAPNGAIILCHMNHPEGQTAEGVMAAVPKMKAQGYRFVRLGNAAR